MRDRLTCSMLPIPTARRSGTTVAALALVVLLMGACTCFDPTIRFDLGPVVQTAAVAPAPIVTPP
jgi:hypothetical protein